MVPNSNPNTSTMSKEERHAAWKTLARDAKGRFQKRKSTSDAKCSSSPDIEFLKKSKLLPISGKCISEEQVQTALNEVQNELTRSCPRCAGDMSRKTIRCGPDRVVAVQKCAICNYYIPIT
jgi:hypothetical protein